MTLTVANTILQQLGGNRFAAMTGAKEFVGSENSLKFKIGKNGAGVSHVSVTLEAGDTYSLRFMKWNARKLEMVTKVEKEGVYCDNLQAIFTDVTGLYTRF